MEVTTENPRYPCHPDRMVKFYGEAEKELDKLIQKRCPECRKRWVVRRVQVQQRKSLRLDRLEWQEGRLVK